MHPETLVFMELLVFWWEKGGTAHVSNLKKIIEFNVTQEACDEMNALQEELFGDLPQDTKDILGIHPFVPHKLKCLFG